MHASLERRLALAVLLLTLVLAATGSLRAQEQESVAMQRMLHPDQTLKFNDADRKFDGSAAVGTRQAVVRPFLFARPASTKAGDGAFRTHSFDGATPFAAKDFSTKAAPAASRDAYNQNGKTYAVKAVAVHADRAAGKTLDTHTYISSEKPFLIRGKRQDTIDDLRASKDMTIDQVRDLLNKNQ